MSTTTPTEHSPVGSTHWGDVTAGTTVAWYVAPVEVWLARPATRAASIDRIEELKRERLDAPAVNARHGFQQMCRVPCYRGVRTR